MNKVSMFNNYISSVFNVSAEDDHITNTDSDVNVDTGSAPLTNLEHTLPNFHINAKIILKTINSSKVSKSPGPDKIYPKILKKLKTR